MGLLVSPALAENSVTPKMLDQFTTYAQQVETDWKIPGMAIAIVQNDKIIYVRGFGYRNMNKSPVTGDTIFDIASLTKSFTAGLLAMQIDQGKYTWDTPVFKLYSLFQLYDAKTTHAFAVRDLIAHDSGLPEGALSEMGDFGYSAEQTLNALRYVKPIAEFRRQFAYQDVFLEVAKKIIESNSGLSYADNLNTKIFIPLDMKNSYVRTDPKLKELDNVAEPFLYYLGKNYTYPEDYPYLSQGWALSAGVAGGGIKSSAVDIAKWMIFNMNPSITSLISKENINYIHSPQTIIARKNKIEQAYGEGWFIDKTAYYPDDVLYHPGGGTGMHALMAYIPQVKIGIVILTNQYGNKAPEALYPYFFDLYFGKKPLRDWSKLYLAEQKKISENKAKNYHPLRCINHETINLNKYTGLYSNPIYGKLKLVAQGNSLLLTIGPQGVMWRLTYCQDQLFKAYWPNPGHKNIPMLSPGDDQVEFILDANAKVYRMVIPLLNENNLGIFVKEAR